MKIYYSGVGESVDFVRIFDLFHIEHEQMNLPAGCPDWVIEPTKFVLVTSDKPVEFSTNHGTDANCMVEIKWSRADLVQSYESHHLHAQLLYGCQHSRHMALGIVKTPWHWKEDKDKMDKKYRGMKQAIWADFQVPIIEEDNPEALVHTMKGYIEKAIEEGREIITEHQLPPVYNHVDAGQDEPQRTITETNIRSLMCINGLGPDRARRIIYKHGHIGSVIKALKEYDLDVDDVGNKTVQAMIDHFKQLGLITNADICDMPVDYLCDSLSIKGQDKKLLRKHCPTVMDALAGHADLTKETIDKIFEFMKVE